MNLRKKQVLATHSLGKDLVLSNPFYREQVEHFIMGSYFFDGLSFEVSSQDFLDVTTQMLGLKGKVKALFCAKQEGVLAGVEETQYVLEELAKKEKVELNLRFFFPDGCKVQKGTLIGEIEADVAFLLRVERTALNLLQRMSGVATVAHTYQEMVKNTEVLLTPTRKTLWGALDKKACYIGSVGTHRLNLADAVLVKDNHWKFLQNDVEFLFQKIASYDKQVRFFEIEVENQLQLERFISGLGNANNFKQLLIVMFDNFSPQQIYEGISTLSRAGLRDRVFFEASGGISGKNLLSYAQTGVDIISMGALTNSSHSLDISLEF